MGTQQGGGGQLAVECCSGLTGASKLLYRINVQSCACLCIAPGDDMSNVSTSAVQCV